MVVDEYIPDIPSAKIVSITNQGALKIDFGVEMWIPNNISIIPLDLQIIPGELSKPQDLKYQIIGFQG